MNARGQAETGVFRTSHFARSKIESPLRQELDGRPTRKSAHTHGRVDLTSRV